jgi:DNA-binding NarL/FixJ family response regulator
MPNHPRFTVLADQYAMRYVPLSSNVVVFLLSPPSNGLVDEEPTYLRGLEAAFAAHGYTTRPVADPVQWLATTSGPRCLVVSEQPRSNLRALERAKDFCEDVGAVALTSDPTAAATIALLGHGADGIMPRRAPTESIVEAVSLVLRGSTILPPGVARTLMTRVQPSETPASLPAPELELLQLIAEGATTSSISERLACSERTVFRRQQRLFRRLRVESRTAAVCVALQRGILVARP